MSALIWNRKTWRATGSCGSSKSYRAPELDDFGAYVFFIERRNPERVSFFCIKKEDITNIIKLDEFCFASFASINPTPQRPVQSLTSPNTSTTKAMSNKLDLIRGICTSVTFKCWKRQSGKTEWACRCGFFFFLHFILFCGVFFFS